jgi:hypothetical protein
MREALRDILPTSFACLVLLDGLFARRRHAGSCVALCRDAGMVVVVVVVVGGGGGGGVLATGPPTTPKARTRPHMQKRSEVVAEAAVATCAHAV